MKGRSYSAWAGRIAFAVMILAVGLLAAGCIYQAIGEANDARLYPPPGEMVDVGGYKLHLYCTGAGSPTVILETLSGGISPTWGWVQPQVAAQTRVCSYDRDGLAWSESSGESPTLERTARGLRTLLANAGITGPYILVGHSIGGLYVREFTTLYPEDVAGIVLVDSSHPEEFERIPALEASRAAYVDESAVFPLLARLGLFRLYFATGGELDFRDLPPREHAEVAVFWSSPRFFEKQRPELLAELQIFADARRLGSLGNLPLMVVSAEEGSPIGWADLQNELAQLSSDSVHRTVDNATHASLAFHPRDANTVSAAILEMVKARQAGARLNTK